MNYPNKILHWIEDQEVDLSNQAFFVKRNPATGEVLAEVISGNKQDVEKAIESAVKAFKIWSAISVIKRSEILRNTALLLAEHKEEIAKIIALESGKPEDQALGEVSASVESGLFIAGEGRRYYGKILQTAVLNRSVSLIRESIGPGALIVPFNSPMASIAWKVFPALLCGNSVVLKSNEHTPYIAIWFAKLLKSAGLPIGVFSVLQGSGSEVGSALVADKRIEFVALTGSSNTASSIIKATADRLAKVSVEAGGKNPIVVCDDADLENAVSIAISSAFVDAGQRCAAASRIIIFDSVYDKFKMMFLKAIQDVKIGIKNGDTFGAIISENHLNRILDVINSSLLRGAKIIAGGKRIVDNEYKNGYFLSATVLENISPDDEISQNEIFGPVVILYKARDFDHAVLLANNSKYKLSGAIHTKSINRAQEFIKRYRAGVVRVNGPTYGSEPHMPFGGPGFSGNGWREPGDKALDFYSEWKQISIDYNINEI